ncbi:MAG: hypothetical protein MUC83_04245 [Pirellula sp.]|nr:hypothetical protein [Pirellula sp.]
MLPQQVQAPQQSHVPQVHSEQSHASQSHLLQHVSHSQTSQVQPDLAAVTADTARAADAAGAEQQPVVQVCDSPVAHSHDPHDPHEHGCD